MGFWSDTTLLARLEAEGLVEPFDKLKVETGHYVLTVGPEVYISPTGRSSETVKDSIKTLKESEWFSIPAGQFGFLQTEEEVKIPIDAIALISIKAKIKYRGLVNVSGFHVDPGFSGRLKFSVFNAGPASVFLRRGQPCFMIWFASLDKPQKPGQFRTEEAHLVAHLDPNEVVPGQVPSYSVLEQRLTAVENQQRIYTAVAGFLISLALIVFAASFQHVKEALFGTSASSPAPVVSVPTPHRT